MGHQKRKLRIYAGGWEKHDRTPVPGNARELSVALASPGLVSAELLPGRGIEGGAGPSWIVAGVELPWAVEWDGSLAEPVDDDRGGRRVVQDWRCRMARMGGECEDRDGDYAGEVETA